MVELFVGLIVWFLIEVVFWGVMFWTGYAVILIVTAGRWIPVNVRKGENKVKENRKAKKFIGIAALGTLFWFLVGIGILSISIIF